MNNEQIDVWKFHFDVLGKDMPDEPEVPTPRDIDVRMRLLKEEFEEAYDALTTLRTYAAVAAANDGNTPVADPAPVLGNVGHELVDLLYVAYGAAVVLGLDLEPFWTAVHTANMAKKGGKIVNGKLTKPAGWVPPNGEAVLRSQMLESSTTGDTDAH